MANAKPRRRRRRPGAAGGATVSALEPAFECEEADDDSEVAFGEMSRAEKRRRLCTIRSVINTTIDSFSDEDGWVSLAQVGDQLGKRLPDFDVRNYGYKRLRPFLKSLGVYEFDEPAGPSGLRQIYLRVREG